MRALCLVGWGFVVVTLFGVSPLACGDDGKALPTPAERVIAEVVRPETLDHPVMVFASPQPLAAGMVVVPADVVAAPDRDDGTWVALGEPSWFFMVDDAPYEFFAHPVRFVTVGADSGAITVREASFWPTVDGEPLLPTKTSELLAPGVLVFDSLGPEIDPPPPFEIPEDFEASTAKGIAGCPTPKRYAIVVAGGGHFGDRLAYSAQRVFNRLQQDSFSAIYGLWGESGDYAAFGKLIGIIAASAQCMDEVLVYIIAHGANPGDGSKGNALVIGGTQLHETTLGGSLALIKSCNITVIIEACFSGGMIDGVAHPTDKQGNDVDSGVARVMTSAASDEEGVLLGDATGTGGTPATNALLQSWGNAPAPGEGDYGAFLQEAWEAANDKNPFVNGDAQTELGFNEKATDRPQIDVRTKECPCCCNGKVEKGETCDPPHSPASCTEMYDGYCDAKCQKVVATPWCGDGCKSSGEQCDTGTSSFGFGPAPCPAPDASCEGCECIECGNGIKTGGEQCDNGSDNGAPQSCAEMYGGWCDTDCTKQMATPACGDGCLNGGETCDPGTAFGLGPAACPHATAICNANCTCTCGTVTFTGECDGDKVLYCDNGVLKLIDCAPYNKTCGWDAMNSFYDCVPK